MATEMSDDKCAAATAHATEIQRSRMSSETESATGVSVEATAPNETSGLPWVGFALICAITFAGGLVVLQFAPRSDSPDVKYYRAMRKAMDEIREARVSNPGELPALKMRFMNLAREVTRDLKQGANRDQPAKQYLLWAARDAIPRFVSTGFENADSEAEKLVDSQLNEAAYALRLEKRP